MTQHQDAQAPDQALADPVLPIDDHEAVMAFIRANTKILAPALVPEIKLYLAEESLPIWQ